MRMKVFLTLLFAVFSTTMIYSGARQETAPSETEGSRPTSVEAVSIVDSLGRELTISQPVERVIILSVGAAHAMKILDSWDLVVGRGAYTDDAKLFPGVQELPVLTALGNPYEPNLELLLSLEADLLIAVHVPMPGLPELIEKLESEIDVVAMKFYEPETMVENFINLGKILGKEEEAAEYADWYNGLLDEVSERTASINDEERARVFFKTGMGNVEDLTAFTDEISFAPFRNNITGCINVAGELPSQGGWIPNIDPEWLASQDVDVLVIGDPVSGCFGAGVGNPAVAEAYRSAVTALPVFSNSKAVRNDRVYMLEAGISPSPMVALSFIYQAKWFHPEGFSDLEPSRFVDEYLLRFMDLSQADVDASLYAYPKD